MRVFLITDAPTLPVSYANVGRWMADALVRKGVRVGFGSLQHAGNRLTYEFRGQTYPMYGCMNGTHIEDAVRDFNPDVVVHIRDPVVLIPRLYPTGHYSVKAPANNERGEKVPVIQWIPIMYDYFPYDWVEALHREADLVLTFTKVGAEILGNAGLLRDRLDYLPLGVSPSYSDPDGPVAVGYGRAGTPLVMSMGLGHQDRKAFPLLMRAYRDAKRVDPDLEAEFYLHTTQMGAYDLITHARMMGVEGQWLFPHGYDPGTGYTEEDIAERYRRAGVYVSVGTGEGYDLPLAECAALGRVLVYPDEPIRSEVVGDYEGPKFAVRTFPLPQNVFWLRMMSVEDLALQLRAALKAAPDPAAGKRYYARHSWETVANRFIEIVKERGWW